MYFLVRMQNTRIPTVKQIFRYIFTDDTDYNIWKESKIINKLIYKGSKRDPLQCLKAPSNKNSKNQLSVHTVRRMNVLNKVFMEYVTDMLSTGEIEPELLNRNIEISHVKVTADFKYLNIHWINNCPEKFDTEDTEEMLQQCAFQLRHNLSQLQVIGNVPIVQFVKCKGINRMQEIEEKFKNLDLPEDYVPSPYPNAIHHVVTITETSDKDAEIQDDKNLQTSENNFHITVPIMKHDVFELDHYKIMSKIKASFNKSKVLNKHREVESDWRPTTKLDLKDVPNFLTDKEEQEQFTKFLKQKKKEKRLKLKNRLNINDCNYDL